MTLSTHYIHRTEITKSNWWLEIGTFNPICIYFFGPFENEQEAESSKDGFFHDLKGENARVIYSNVQFRQPRQLTIEAKELTINDLKHSLSAVLQAL